MLGCHPMIATVGELSGVKDDTSIYSYHCSCGKKVCSCDFWNKVVHQLKNNNNHYFNTNNTIPKRLIPRSNTLIDRLQYANLKYNILSDFRDYVYNKNQVYSQYTKDIIQKNLELASIILEIMHKDLFLDSSKNPNKIKYLAKNVGCEFCVIHLVKDGRGVFDSFKRYHPEMSDKEAILRWKYANKFAERSMKYVSNQNRYILLYKDLVKYPEMTLINLCKFLKIDFSPRCLNFRDSDHHIIGNTKMRLGSTSEIYYDEKWKTGLSTKQLKIFDQLAGKMNNRYGYYS
jgi:hypothetical protein